MTEQLEWNCPICNNKLKLHENYVDWFECNKCSKGWVIRRYS